MYEECDTMIIATNLGAWSLWCLDKLIHWESEHTNIPYYNLEGFKIYSIWEYYLHNKPWTTVVGCSWSELVLSLRGLCFTRALSIHNRECNLNPTKPKSFEILVGNSKFTHAQVIVAHKKNVDLTHMPNQPTTCIRHQMVLNENREL